MRVIRTQAETSPTLRRRWVWELVQNVRDVHHKGGVHIGIDQSDDLDQLEFMHTGKPFTADNIRFLIEQISTKDRERDESGLRTTTGKFGTGFLTTHLLSERVTVRGLAKEPELEFKKFQFDLDRSGYDLPTIAAAVESAKQSVQNLDELPTYHPYDPKAFNTSFIYHMADELSQRVAKDGLDDLHSCLPYALVLVPEVLSVSLSPGNTRFSATAAPAIAGGRVRITHVWRSEPSEQGSGASVTIATICKGLTSLSVPISLVDDKVYIQPLPPSVPRLFCDFPLVGTESFPFPAIVNNPHFEATDARDGILLTGTVRPDPLVAINRQIIRDAIELFFELLEIAVLNNWQNLYQLFNIHPLPGALPWVTADWFDENVFNPVQQRLLHARTVTTAKESEKAAMLQEDNSIYVWFPHSPRKEVRQMIWALALHWFPHCLPAKEEFELWHPLIWKECGRLTTTVLCEFVEGRETVDKLAVELVGAVVGKWLKHFYTLLDDDKQHRDVLVNTKAIFPDQHGSFRQLAELYKESGDIEEDFKDILGLLDHDVRSLLASRSFTFEIPEQRTICLQDVVDQISTRALKKAHDREAAQLCQEPFGRILKWFRENPERAPQLFPELYSQKHLLYDDEVLMENMGKAEQLDELMRDTGVGSIAELRELLIRTHRPALQITQEALASMGITSQAEWEEALKDQDLAALFSHESVPTLAMFRIAQKLIERAKIQITNHLRTLSGYDMTHVEEVAPTVLAGITKDGREIQIVARPAYSHEVIIYYTAERDVLDYEDSELWVDLGTKQRRVTLGHILKTTKIKKFPI